MTSLDTLKETVKRELPAWIEADPAFREAIRALTDRLYIPRGETNDWFHQTLEEMRRERERQDALWRQNNELQDALWRKNDERLEREHRESELKWEANQVELKALHEESLALGKHLDRSIGALGARWGLRSEKAFRDALAGVLGRIL